MSGHSPALPRLCRTRRRIELPRGLTPEPEAWYRCLLCSVTEYKHFPFAETTACRGPSSSRMLLTSLTRASVPSGWVWWTQMALAPLGNESSGLRWGGSRIVDLQVRDVGPAVRIELDAMSAVALQHSRQNGGNRKNETLLTNALFVLSHASSLSSGTNNTSCTFSPKPFAEEAFGFAWTSPVGPPME